jgi:hypothetical protein
VDSGRQPLDPIGQLAHGVLEGVGSAYAGRVGNRPVQPVTGLGAELFVRGVAHGNHKIVRS